MTTTKPAGYLYDWTDINTGCVVQNWFSQDPVEVAMAPGAHNIRALCECGTAIVTPTALELASLPDPRQRIYRSTRTDPPPIGVRLNLLTNLGAHTQGVLSPVNFKDFAGWEHMARASENGMIT